MLARVSRSIAAAVVLFAALPAVCAAQSDAPVAKPEVKAGDRWTYNWMNYWTNTPDFTYELEVTFAQKDAILTVSKRKGGERETDANWTSEWNAVSNARGMIFKPSSQGLKFPLRIGATYSGDFEMEQPRLGAWLVRHERTMKVVGWEDVVVPAGKFRALRIEANGTFQRLDTSIAGTAKTVIWYVPEVKRWVKFTYEDATNRGPFNKNGEELVEFKVQ